VATDVAGRAPKMYDPILTPSDQVADAVVASMTIPLFFRPFPFGPNNYYVDSGLLSNFPAWLFDDENNQRKQAGQVPLPVLGIRLVAPRPATDITTTREYLASLIATKLDGGDFLQTRLIERFAGITVELPTGLNAWDFNLDAKTKNDLFDRGSVAAEAALLIAHNRSALGL
jgi:NTE family protein